jgi:predicted esterase
MKLDYKKLLRWPAIVAIFALLLLAGVFIWALWSADRPAELPDSELLSSATGTKTLVVVVHGYQNGDRNVNGEGKYGKMADVLDTVKKSPSSPDVLYIRYPSQAFSNASCFKIAEQISTEIEKREKAYGEIKLVGFSMGALLIRKAYVYGWGETQDLEGDGKTPKQPSKEQASDKMWVHKVSRFVLLAGMNRGWTTMSRPKGMELKNQLLYRTGKFVGWATNTAKLIRQCEKGEPFVSNLRMQWLEVMRQKLKDSNPPTVVQLLGSNDDLVSEDDSRDANACRNFIWIQLSGAGHGDARQFKGEAGSPPETRRMWFSKALEGQNDEELHRLSPSMPPAEDSAITEAVIVLHGIRDYGLWTADFFSPLQQSFLKENPDKGKLLVYRPSYGYFPMGSFLLPIERQKKVRWFMDEVTELKAKYPNLETIHLVGHSNGTYVLATALQNYKALRVGRIVLAGSVLPEDFDWTSPDLAGRFEKVHNFAATGDWVVAFFPHLFEIPPFTLFHNHIGGAGHDGFMLPKSAEGDPVKTEAWNRLVAQTRNVKGGHGAALGEKMIEAMKPFILKGEPIVENPNYGERSKVFAFFSRFPWLVWLGILVVLVLLGWLWYICVRRWFGIALKPKAANAAALLAYCLFILFLLETV